MRRITFNINYNTHTGETIQIITQWNEIINLTTKNHSLWEATIELIDAPDTMEYSYRLMSSYGHVIDQEWSQLRHKIHFEKAEGEWIVVDNWQAIPENRSMYSSAFKNIFFKRESSPKHHMEYDSAKQYVTIQVYGPQVEPQWDLVLCGSCEHLGAWDPQKGIRMNDHDFPLWTCKLEAEHLTNNAEYKFVVIDRKSGNIIGWEERANRKLSLPNNTNTNKIRGGLHLAISSRFKTSGCAVPLSALRSPDSWGIGDMRDLLHMIDFAYNSGMHVIQLLPINDTTSTHTSKDSYPYNPISVFALNPMYLCPELIGTLSNKEKWHKYQLNAKKINESSAIDYQNIDILKWNYFKDIYQELGETILCSHDCKDWIEANSWWLYTYAVFCYLRDKTNSSDYNNWGHMAIYSQPTIESMCRPDYEHYKEIMLHVFLQYHLHKQLQKASKYARERGIVLKGDIPIGVSRHSVETWSRPELFNLGMQAGAPPDDFSENGQNWGFPTYNWENIASDDYQWWKNRLTAMSQYFDAYRIDHLLGFFRIWQIPQSDISANLGYFDPALAFTEEELEKHWGLPLFKDRYLNHYLHKEQIDHIFGKHTKAALKYIDILDKDHYTLSYDCDTQQKINVLFENSTSAQERAIRNGLMLIAEQVLFIKDTNKKDAYHPRINATKSLSYKFLHKWEKEHYTNIYNNYYHSSRHDEIWENSAITKLPPIIDSCSMLCCAEDLGMIPNCASSVIKRLQILSLELETMPKAENKMGDFANTELFPYNSVSTTSTHDMPPIREWWHKNTELAKTYHEHILGLDSTKFNNTASSQICGMIVQRTLNSPSILSILPMADWLAISDKTRSADQTNERINDPADKNNKWDYRMHIDIDKLAHQKEVCNQIKHMINISGRG